MTAFWIVLAIYPLIFLSTGFILWRHHRKLAKCQDCGGILHRDIRKSFVEQRLEPIGHKFTVTCQRCGTKWWAERVKKRTRGEKLLAWLKAHVRFKELGWTEIQEIFIRFQLFKSRFGNLYLHWLSAPTWHPKCHDHPWHFWALVIWPGYMEEMDDGKKVWRGPGSLLYRTARFRHNVITPKGPNWSLIVTSGVVRKWGFVGCRQ